MIDGIKLSQKMQSQFCSKYFDPYILGFNKLNIFIGQNNSGKSRLLRSIFSDSKMEFYQKLTFSKNFSEESKDSIIALLNSLLEIPRHYNIMLKNNYLHNIRDHFLKFEENDYKLIFELLRFLNLPNEQIFDLTSINNKLNVKVIENSKNNLIMRLSEFINFNKLPEPALKEIIYVPILRGLRPIHFQDGKFNNEDLYQSRTLNDYFKTVKNKINISTGLNIYEELMKLILGDENERQEYFEFESFLSTKIFQTQITLVPKYGDDVLHIKIGQGKQLEIFNLGDGLQTLIVILFPIFMNRNKENYVFIEEPETHLHPAFQQLLLKSIKSFDKNQYFIATHSNIFINDTDSTIFNIKIKEDKSEVINVDLQKDKLSILKDLGYSQSDLLISNFVLWVEGQSDKIYLNYWIRKLAPELIEGLHYSILIIGGSGHHNFINENQEFNIEFLNSINQNFGIILDSDKQEANGKLNKNKQSIKEFFETNGYYIWITCLREIENYVPLEIYKNAVRNAHIDKTEFELNEGGYIDRGKVIDLSGTLKYKSTIILQNDIYSKVQKHGIEAIKKIPANELKKSIMNSIRKTESRLFSIDKIKVANEIVKAGMSIEEVELKTQLEKLIQEIRKASNLL